MSDLKISTTINDIPRLMTRFPEETGRAVESRVTEAVMLLEREVKINTPIGAGPVNLRDTIFGKVVKYGKSITGIVGTPAVYGEAVEVGTRPHFPPIGPIQHWVQNKLGIEDEKKSRSVAFAIARKISKHGTKGAKMFEVAFTENQSKVLAILEKIPADIIRMVES